MLNKAIEIANRAHTGQVDKGGEPYILHPLRVMMSLTNEVERICAVLHDVIEDSKLTFEDLRSEGFSEEILSALDCLTKRHGESYNDFICRIISNETACRVKLADLSDNMNTARIKNPSEKDQERLIKYRDATNKILQALQAKDKPADERIIKIDGYVSIQPFLKVDDFLDRFIDFVEINGWYFGGTTNDLTDIADE